MKSKNSLSQGEWKAMLETERQSVILGLQKIADTRSVSWWKRNVCLKASEMLRAVVDGRIENRRGHWIDAPALSEITCSVCGKTWNCCETTQKSFSFARRAEQKC